jgi:chorismate synthase
VAGNSFGQLFRITTAGESHGPSNIVIIDGIPPGIPLTVLDIQPDLDRRRPGQSKITSQRKEQDIPEIMSGVFEGKTTGTSLAIMIRNRDIRPRDYEDIKDKYRPGHADFTFDAKYGLRDYRGGGRSSARETVVRVAAGAVAKKMLKELGFSIKILGYVKQIGRIIAAIADPLSITQEQVESNVVRCPDQVVAEKMIKLIENMRSDRDSIGGIAEFVAGGIPAGWGEPVFDKLRSDLAKALFSLPAVMGVEFGAGFSVATARGSENNDEFITSESGTIMTRSNRHGGMLGGISTGLPIIVRCAIKPTSSIPRELNTVTKEGKATKIATKGRHDPCLLPRFIPMGEAMIAVTLADHCLRHRGQTGTESDKYA